MFGLGDIIIRIKADISQLKAGLAEARASVSSTKRSLESAGKAMQKAGMAMTAAVTPLALALGHAVKTGMSFEQSMKNVQSVLGGTQEDFEKLSKFAKQMGEETVFSASEAADAMYYLASAGYKTEQITASLRDILNLAAATQSDLAFTTETVVSTLNAFGLSAKDADRVSNVFAATIANSQATMDKLAYSMRYAAPLFNQLGYSVEDLSAALGMLYNAGYKGEQAGTVLRGALSRLLKPTEEMQAVLEKYNLEIYTNQEEINKARKAYEDAKITLEGLKTKYENLRTSGSATKEELAALKQQIQAQKKVVKEAKEAYEGVAAEGLIPFGELVKKLEKAHLDLGDAVTLFGQEAGPGMLALLNQGAEAYENLKNKITGTQKASEMAEIQITSFAGAIKLIRSKLEAIEIAVFDELKDDISAAAKAFDAALPEIKKFAVTFVKDLLPPLREVGKLIMKFINWFNNLPEPVKATIAQIAALAAAFMAVVGPILMIAGTVLPYLGAALTVLTGPIGLVIAAVGLLATAWINNWFGIRDKTMAAIKALKSGIEGGIKWIQDRINDIINFITSVFDLGRKAYEWGANLLGSFIEGIKSQFRWLTDAVSGAAKIVTDFLGIHSDAKRGPLSDLTSWGENLAKTIAAGIYQGLPQIALASQAAAQTIRNTTVNNSFTIHAVIREEADIYRLADEIDRRLGGRITW